jgi:hypothetical protein
MAVVTMTFEVTLRITAVIENNTVKVVTNKSWGHEGNLALTEKVYTLDDSENRGSKILIPVLSGTFLQRIKPGPL